MLFFHLKPRQYFHELRISDTLWLKGQPKRRLLMQAAKRLASRLGTPFISLMSKDPVNVWESIRFRMFSLQKLAPVVTVREVNDEKVFRLVSDINNWSFTMGDVELF